MADLGKSYSEAQFSRAFAETAKKMLVERALVPVANPCAFLLGGQSGAGKSTLHRLLRKRLEGNVIVINGNLTVFSFTAY